MDRPLLPPSSAPPSNAVPVAVGELMPSDTTGASSESSAAASANPRRAITVLALGSQRADGRPPDEPTPGQRAREQRTREHRAGAAANPAHGRTVEGRTDSPAANADGSVSGQKECFLCGVMGLVLVVAVTAIALMATNNGSNNSPTPWPTQPPTPWPTWRRWDDHNHWPTRRPTPRPTLRPISADCEDVPHSSGENVCPTWRYWCGSASPEINEKCCMCGGGTTPRATERPSQSPIPRPAGGEATASCSLARRNITRDAIGASGERIEYEVKYSDSPDSSLSGEFRQRQFHKDGVESEYLVGTFAGFEGNVARFANGHSMHCPSKRRGTVTYLQEDCDANEPIPVSLIEEPTCVYNMVVKGLCCPAPSQMM